MIRFYFAAAVVSISASHSVAQFTRVLTGPQVSDERSSHGATWIDYDEDGDDDLFVTTESEDLLYRNNGNGTFTRITQGSLVTETGTGRNAAWADYDNDGYPDAFVINQHTSSLFRNSGGSQFEKIAGLPTTGSITNSDHQGGSWGDYDADGDLDLFVSNYALSDASRNLLYENTPNGFIPSNNAVVEQMSSGQPPSWIDFDNNGTLDLFVPNYGMHPLFVYKNNGDKTFTKITAGMPFQFNTFTTGMTWADYDNDGDFDVAFAVNVNTANALYENNGNGTFSHKTNAIPASKSSAMSWDDFDNDGYIDLLCAGGDGDKIYLFKNNGNKTFTDVTAQYGLNNTSYTWAAATADYDKDGFVDIFLANSEGNNRDINDILYHNNGNANHWINIRLLGVSTNRSAIGATITVYAGGHQQKRTIQSLTGPNSQNSLRAHFGLGSNVVADSIVIEWPSKGFQILTDVAGDQFIEIEEIPIPARPTITSSANVDQNKNSVTWSDNSSNETGFRIERSKGDDKNFKMIAEVPSNTTSYIDDNLDDETTLFYYRLFAKASSGLSFASDTISVERNITGIESPLKTFSVYPNPVRSYLKVKGAATNDQFEIRTLLGQLVKNFGLSESEESIYVADLPVGVYILSNRRVSIRIVKMQ